MPVLWCPLAIGTSHGVCVRPCGERTTVSGVTGNVRKELCCSRSWFWFAFTIGNNSSQRPVHSAFLFVLLGWQTNHVPRMQGQGARPPDERCWAVSIPQGQSWQDFPMLQPYLFNVINLELLMYRLLGLFWSRDRDRMHLAALS